MKLVKKNKSLLGLLVIAFVAISLKTTAQIVPSSSNLSYLLNPKADIYLTHKVVEKANTKWVVLEVTTRNEILADSLRFSYSFTNDLDQPTDNLKAVSLKNFELSQSANRKMYAFEPNNNTFKFLILRVGYSPKKKHFTYLINLEKVAGFFVSKTELTIPILDGYSAKNTPLKLARLETSTIDLEVDFYSTRFSASLPPMANLSPENPFAAADTSFTLMSNAQLETNKKGTYRFTEIGNKKAVSHFRIASSTYPQLATIDEIIEASIFLFTKKEKDKLTSSTTPKKDYDAFWLENTNSSEQAGRMISAYFMRVKEANKLFSTYKEGWKTDMGMIYIIFGRPDNVFKSNEKVEWVYKKTYELPSLYFSFSLKQDKLDTEQFELERNMNYQNTWFRAIDLWRKGRKNL